MLPMEAERSEGSLARSFWQEAELAQGVHSLTHPGAKIDRPAKAETKPAPNTMLTESVLDLNAALDAEAAEEAEVMQPQRG